MRKSSEKTPALGVTLGFDAMTSPTEELLSMVVKKKF
jgi:hypothetical protein